MQSAQILNHSLIYFYEYVPPCNCRLYQNMEEPPCPFPLNPSPAPPTEVTTILTSIILYQFWLFLNI